MILKTSFGSRKSTQALGAPGKTEKALITNKVATRLFCFTMHTNILRGFSAPN